MSFFDDKDPDAKPVMEMNFVDRLKGATITGATWTILDAAGAEQPTLKLGTIDISAAPFVRQQWQGGIDGMTYLHHVVVVPSTGANIVGNLYQKVRRGA